MIFRLPTRCPSRRKMHVIRIRHYLAVLLLSLSCCFFFLLFLSISVNNLGPLPQAANSSEIRPNSCQNCFHAHFPILINHPEICSVNHGETIDMVFFIFTRPGGLDTRTAIRNTWASVTRNNTGNVRHVFVMGWSPDATRMRRLEEESGRFRDIVVSDFVDSYQNLTLKTVSSLHWITRYCSHARYFFKVDDDVWLNIPRLLQSFQHSVGPEDGLGGYCKMVSSVIRETSSKWYASYTAYPDDAYPEYCSGVGYGGTLNLAPKLLNASQNVPFFHLEDVYMGLVLRELNLKPVHFQELNAHRGWDLCEAFSDRVMSYHHISPWLLRKIWGLKSCHLNPVWRLLKLDFVLL